MGQQQGKQNERADPHPSQQGPASPHTTKPTPPTGPKPMSPKKGPEQKSVEPTSEAEAPINPATRTLINSKLTVDQFELLTVVGKGLLNYIHPFFYYSDCSFLCPMKGSFGKVMQVRKKDTGKIYAMKVLKKKSLIARKQIQHTITERRVLEEIDHPFVVSLR